MQQADEHLQKLNMAAALLTFQRGLRRFAFSSLGWGAFSCVMGLILLRGGRGDVAVFGFIDLGLGCLLVAEGTYLLFVHNPRAILVEAATLGLLGIYNLGLFLLSWYSGRSLGGNPLVGVAQLLWAIYDYYQHRMYAAVFENADRVSVSYVNDLLQDVNRADGTLRDDEIEFEVKQFLEAMHIWRVRLLDGVAFFLRNTRRAFFWAHAVEAFFTPKRDIRLEYGGKSWLSKRPKVNLHIGSAVIKNSRMTPEMLERMETWLSGSSPSLAGSDQQI